MQRHILPQKILSAHLLLLGFGIGTCRGGIAPASPFKSGKLREIMSEPLVDEVKKIARREAERIVRILLPKTVDDKLSDINKRLLLTEKMIHSASASNDPESTKKLAGTEMVTFRIQHGLSQRELALLLGSHYTSICRWEKGRFHPGTSTIQLFEELRHMKHDEITAKLKTLSATQAPRCHALEVVNVGPDSREETRSKR